MSGRDYRAMAQAIRYQREQEVEASRLTDTLEGVFAVEALALRIADLYAADNPRFDRARFVNAAIGSADSITGTVTR